MKNLRLLALLSSFAAFIYSCDTLPCEDVDCGEHGTCNESDGSCICETGFVWNDSAATCLLHCLVTPCPPNSTCNEATEVCECDSGFIMIPNGLCIDLCSLVDCGPNGNCDFNTGECNCDPGFGPGNLNPCEAFNLKFGGEWLGSHTDELGNSTGPYTMMALSDQNDPTKVRFDNFMMYQCTGQPALSVIANTSIDGLSIVSFESLCPDWQTVNPTDMSTLANSGNTLEVSVNITSGSTSSTLNGTYTRQ